MNAVTKPAELKPGIYEGLSMEEYLAMPACSASTILTLLQRCERAAWFGSWLNEHRPATSSTAEQSVGTLAHALLLEGRLDKLQVIDPNDHPAERTGNIPDSWTNKSIRAARDAALRAGMVPVFPKVAKDIERMATEALAYLDSVRHDEPAVFQLFQPGCGKSEVTIVWEEDGCLFRMRPDRLADDMGMIGDLKTTATAAEPDRWGRTQLFGMGYYIAAAFYRRGLEAATGKRAEYVYLAQEQEAPYLCSLIGLDPMAQQIGAKRAHRGIERWKECVHTGVWRGYPTRVAYPEMPGYEAAREEAIEAAGHAYDYPQLGWKKPEKIGFEGERDPIY